MFLLVLAVLSFLQMAYGQEGLEDYFAFLEQLEQPNGHFEEGEIEIVVDRSKILEIQSIQKDRLLKKGFSPHEAEQFSKIGLVYEDQYLVLLRDAVYFPKKIPGTYDRLIWKSSLKAGSEGSAILPVLTSGEIALNLNYRHATRSWEFELPRGCKENIETDEETALRELKEETGLDCSSLVFLGVMTSNTGILCGPIPIFWGDVSEKGIAHPEESEAISKIVLFTPDEIKQGLIQGFLETTVQENRIKVPLRDSFLAFAFLQAELRGLFNKRRNG